MTHERTTMTDVYDIVVTETAIGSKTDHAVTVWLTEPKGASQR